MSKGENFGETLKKYLNSVIRGRINLVIEKKEYITPNHNGKTPLFIKNEL